MNENLCPCGSGKTFEDCCKGIIDGSRKAITAEDLMRARYSAYATGAIDFIMNSTLPEERKNCDRKEIELWSKESEWEGFQLISSEAGGATDEEGKIEFVATYKTRGQTIDHHEISTFKKIGQTWFFADGKMVTQKPYIRATPKVGPNDPCPCGSGKKFKKCCGK